MRVGIDNYGLHPLELNPLDTLRWAKANGAQGVQFSGLSAREREKIDTPYLKDLVQFASENDLYIEWGGGQHIPLDMESWKEKEIFEINRKAAEEASLLGTSVVRSCSGGLMRWNSQSPTTETILIKTAEALKSQRSMLKDYGAILAIETHFEFTTHELCHLFELCDAEPGDYLGICLDSMNLLTMLEDPLCASQRILPWVVGTHLKDGALLLDGDGLVTFPTEIGSGVIDLKEILSRLASLERDITLSIEDHGGSFRLPVFDPLFLSKFPDLTAEEFSRIIRMATETRQDMNEGRCSITERERWPEICEERLCRDIQAVKALASDLR
jgi:sugar phosphate isomerase/epimerase